MKSWLPIGVLVLVLAICLGSQDVGADVAQKGKIRVQFTGALSPNRLPRHGSKAISVKVGGRVSTVDGSTPPELRQIAISLNRHGHLNYRGLPACRLEQIQPSTNRDAMRACGKARVGQGRFFADIEDPSRSPFPSEGKLVAFNGTEHGHPVLFAHVFGTTPLPISYTVAFRISSRGGTFGTRLLATLPSVPAGAGRITGIELSLHRTFRYHGRRYSYLSAGCPLPAGIDLALFPFARAEFVFRHRSVSAVLQRPCSASG